MRHLIQKFSLALVVPLLGMLLPAFMTTPASAVATKPGGTCILETNQGKQVLQVATCKSFKPTGKDSSGTAWSSTKCYGLSEQNGSVLIEATLSCTDSLFFGAQPVICQNGSPAPNNDITKCTSTTGVTCGDGTPPPCTGETVVNDPAGGSGNCASVSKCDLVTKYVNPFINFLAALVGVAVVISIVIGGIQYGSSAGDPQKVNMAKNRIRNALVALLAFLFLYALLNFLVPGGLL
jgi:hypothetical protein